MSPADDHVHVLSASRVVGVLTVRFPVDDHVHVAAAAIWMGRKIASATEPHTHSASELRVSTGLATYPPVRRPRNNYDCVKVSSPMAKERATPTAVERAFVKAPWSMRLPADDASNTP